MKKINVKVSDELHQAWPQFRGAAVFASVVNSAYNAELWRQIDEYIALYRKQYTVDSIKEMPTIQATRQAYKKYFTQEECEPSNKTLNIIRQIAYTYRVMKMNGRPEAYCLN